MKNKIIAYASDFASFLLENGIEPRKIILFGSAATGEFGTESDVDIFVDIDEKNEKNIMNILKIFNNTFGEKWKLKSVHSPISLKIGNLDKWHGLKRSIQSHGILLYGKYNEFPEDMKSYMLFRLDFSGISRANKVSLWRKLYGYTQTSGKKRYDMKGIVENFGGKKLEKGIILIPSEKSADLRKFLNKNKIKFLINEIWSDDI